MNNDDKTLKACIYDTDSARILEILEKINFTGKCRIKTENLTFTLTEKEGVFQSAKIETEDNEIPPQFTGLKDSFLIKKITEINPHGIEIRLYTEENKENGICWDKGKAKTTKTAEELSNGPDSLFEDELSNLDSASIIKMKEKFRHEMENLVGEILKEKNE